MDLNDTHLLTGRASCSDFLLLALPGAFLFDSAPESYLFSMDLQGRAATVSTALAL